MQGGQSEEETEDATEAKKVEDDSVNSVVKGEEEASKSTPAAAPPKPAVLTEEEKQQQAQAKIREDLQRCVVGRAGLVWLAGVCRVSGQDNVGLFMLCGHLSMLPPTTRVPIRLSTRLLCAPSHVFRHSRRQSMHSSAHI